MNQKIELQLWETIEQVFKNCLSAANESGKILESDLEPARLENQR